MAIRDLYDDTRSDWDARPPVRSLSTVAVTARTEFFNHYVGADRLGLASKPHSECLKQVRAWQAFHTGPSRGWSDLGYNVLVCQHGRAIEGRGVQFSGAHCPDHNTSGIGAQFMVGGNEVPTEAAYARMARLYAECNALAGKTLKKRGHRDGTATACPGDTIYKWVQAGMPAPDPEDDMPLTTADADLILNRKLVPSLMLGSEETVSPVRALDLLLRWGLEARDNAVIARKIAEAQAAKGDALTPEEISAIGTAVGEKLAAGFDLNLTPKAGA